MNASEGDQAIGIDLCSSWRSNRCAGVKPMISARRSDQADALDVDGIQIAEEVFGVVAVVFDFVESVRPR